MAQRSAFPHVDQFTEAVEHAVNAGHRGTPLLDFVAKPRPRSASHHVTRPAILAIEDDFVGIERIDTEMQTWPKLRRFGAVSRGLGRLFPTGGGFYLAGRFSARRLLRCARRLCFCLRV